MSRSPTVSPISLDGPLVQGRHEDIADSSAISPNSTASPFTSTPSGRCSSILESQILLNERAPLDASSTNEKLRYAILAEEQQPSAMQIGHKSWRAFYLMMIGLILGLGLSLVHHFVDQSLDGKVVANIDETFHLSQTSILSIGALLAFMVKTCFAAAVGVAFVQRQWLNLHCDTFTVKELDNITSVLTDQSRLTKKALWRRVPLLAIVATISWALPLAIISPPGALTVGNPAPYWTYPYLQVPQLHLDMINSSVAYNLLTAQAAVDEHAETCNLISTAVPFPPPAVRRIMLATASSGYILPLNPRYANQSYDLEFFAPNLNCASAAEDVVRNATQMYGFHWDPELNVVQNTPPGGWYGTKASAWTMPSSKFFDFAFNASGLHCATDNGFGPFDTFVDIMSEDASRIFVMSNHGFWNGSQPVPTVPGLSGQLMQVNVTECKLYNASYSVEFRFEDSKQITTASVSNLNPIPFLNIMASLETVGTPHPGPTKISYLILMEAFNLFLVGETGKSQSLAAQGKTNIDLIHDIDLTSAEEIANTMMILFQNFTLSLLTEPLLSNEIWSPAVPIEVISWPNMYVYTPRNLLIAYGLAFVFSLVCCLIGMHAFINNDNSFQNLLSTYLRATKEAGIRSLVEERDRGADPLPKTLGQANLSIVGCKPPTARMRSKSSRFWWNEFGI